MERIGILLACYNGEKYLREQLESVLLQDYREWRLIIRDDSSTDDTLRIIDEFATRDNRIEVVRDGHGNLGALGNFQALMQTVTGGYDYYMFCDQDDVWERDKISMSYEAMKRMELKNDATSAILVYTDFSYVNEDLKRLPVSVDLRPFGGLRTFSGLFLQNPVYGCTILCNNRLLENILPIPEGFENHDYWIAFVAASIGQIEHIPYPTVRYRQHSANVTSAYSSGTIGGRFRKLFEFRTGALKEILSKNRQVAVVRQRFASALSDDKRVVLDEYVAKWRGPRIALVWFMVRQGIIRRTVFQSILWFLRVLVVDKSRVIQVFEY